MATYTLDGAYGSYVSGQIRSVNGNILSEDSGDIWQFSVDDSSEYLQIYLHNLSDDADIFLYFDSNDDGVLDDDDPTLDASINVGTQADYLSVVNLDGAGDRYFLVVNYFASDASSLSYDLDFVALDQGFGFGLPDNAVAPIPLGPTDAFFYSGQVSGDVEAAETFMFSMTQRGVVSAALGSANGNPTFRAFADSNGNGIFDSDDGLLGEFSGAGESLSFFTSTDVIFAQVLKDPGFDPAEAMDYELALSYSQDPLTGMDDSVYRFYNAAAGVHFYTSNVAERDNLINNAPAYTYEGAAFNVQNELPIEGSPLTPLFRFYNTAAGNHFYTANAAERDSVIANLPQYQFEGTAFYVLGADVNLGQPMYRFFNTATGTHFYTANAAERDAVMATLPQYTFEGEVFEVA